MQEFECHDGGCDSENILKIKNKRGRRFFWILDNLSVYITTFEQALRQ